MDVKSELWQAAPFESLILFVLSWVTLTIFVVHQLTSEFRSRFSLAQNHCFLRLVDAVESRVSALEFTDCREQDESMRASITARWSKVSGVIDICQIAPRRRLHRTRRLAAPAVLVAWEASSLRGRVQTQEQLAPSGQCLPSLTPDRRAPPHDYARAVPQHHLLCHEERGGRLDLSAASRLGGLRLPTH